MEEEEKICFDWQPKNNRGKLINATIHCKAMLLEYIAQPSHGLIQVKIADGNLYVYCGSKEAFLNAMYFCYSNNDPNDWGQYEQNLLTQIYEHGKG